MQIAEVYVGIRPKVEQSEFKGAITKAAVPAATKAGQETGKAFGAGMKSEVSVVRGLSILAAGAGAGVFLRGAKNEIQQSIVAGAQLSAVLKSTGGAAGVTEQHANELSETLGKQIAVDNDLIKHNEAILLSFRHVQNQMGAGNDVFDRAIKDAADLTGLFEGDLQGATLQLGKALENPVQGLTALARSGVGFTEQQKAQIKTLVESNDLLGAQKIILGEVEAQVGGTAAAIAAKNPFQQFDVSMKEFQESVGRDLLPTLSVAFKVLEDLLGVFGAIPKPLRELGAGLAVLAVGAVGIAKVTTALKGLSDVFLVTAAAEETTAVAAAQAAGAQEAVAATAAQAAVAEEAATAATLGLSAAFAGLAVGVGAGIVLGNQLNDWLAGAPPDVDALTKSFEDLAKSGQISGDAAKQFGGDLGTLAAQIATVNKSTASKLFGGDFAGANQDAKRDIKALNTALTNVIDKDGVKAAYAAFTVLRDRLLATGTSVEDVNQAFDPFLVALGEAGDKAATSAGQIDTVAASLKNLFEETLKPRSEQLALDDSIASANDALKDLNDTRKEAAGLGPKSVAAAEAEAQAVQGVTDANKGVVDAQHGVADAMRSAEDASRSLADAQRNLAEAQRDLAKFDSPVEQTIRTLQRQQITERDVVTPEDVRQKRLDLLQNDLKNSEERRSLQEKVADETRGVADANRGLADAMRGVVDAQGKVREAALKVGEAEGKVGEAAQKRRLIQVEAANDIRAKERKVEEAILAAGDALVTFSEHANPDQINLYTLALGQLANTLDPSGVLARNLRNITDEITHLKNVAALASVIDISSLGKTAILDFSQAPPSGPLSAADRQRLHQLGVPGFATGGIVPGAPGAPLLALVHGGERVETRAQQELAPVTVHQTNNYIDSQRSAADAEFSARELGWMLRRRGRRA